MDEVAEYCDKIAVLADGELKLVSTPAELFTSEKLLGELHIEMPGVTAIACRLAERGLPVSRAVLTKEQLESEILRIKGVRA